MSDNNYGPVWTVDSQEVGGFILIALFLFLIPVLPAGDIAIYLLNSIHKEIPKIIYFVAWAISSVLWWFVLELLAEAFLSQLSRTQQIIVFYLQGVILSIIITSLGMGKFSVIIALLVRGVYDYLISPFN